MLNEHKIIGRVGQDPQVRHLENGMTVATFSVATNDKKKQGTDWVEETTWHNAVAWKHIAEIVEKYVKKGDLIYISGKSSNRSYEKDGVTKYVTELVAKDLKMLGGNNNASQSAPSPQVNQDAPTDDLPF